MRRTEEWFGAELNQVLRDIHVSFVASMTSWAAYDLEMMIEQDRRAGTFAAPGTSAEVVGYELNVLIEDVHELMVVRLINALLDDDEVTEILQAIDLRLEKLGYQYQRERAAQPA